MKMSRLHVECECCKGSGWREVTGVYRETFELVKKNPGMNGAALAALAGCKATAMNNRLTAMEKLDLVESEEFGREKRWNVCELEPMEDE